MGVFVSTFIQSSFSQEGVAQNLASNIFKNKTLIVPNNVKNFVILIPNEAHESPLLPKDQRLINQPYVPQKLVTHPDTKIFWFVGDVGHTRKVTLNGENSKEIISSVLKFNTGSEPLSLNQNGNYTYFERNANKEDPNFVMNGSIIVRGTDNQSNFGNSDNRLKFTYDTMSTLMVPTRDIEKHVKTLDENNVSILDQYSFKDLRQTGGGGANQTLLVLGSNNSVDMLISVLKKITSSLPYS